MNRRIFAALLSAATLATSAVAAAPLDLKPMHKPKYAEGVKKQSGGDYAVALAAFESIPVHERSYDTRLHIASCKARLDRLIAAAAELEEVIALAKVDKLSATQREAIIDTAKSDLDALLLETPHLLLTVSARTKNATVAVDGRSVAVPSDEVVDPGAHVVTATREGAEIFRKEVRLERGGKLALEIDVAPVVSAPAPAKAIAPRDDTRSGPPALSYVALGGGVAFGALAVVGFLQRGGAYDEYKASCETATGCDSDLRTPVRRWEAIAFTSAGLAVIGVGVGIYLLAKPRVDVGRTSVALSVTPSSIQLFGRF